MVDKLRAELAGLSAKIQRLNKIDTMLQSLTNEKRELRDRERGLKYALTKEETDVERLEKTTATSIFYSILGKKDVKLSREQQEAYAAKLKYDAAVCQLDGCNARMAELNHERDTLVDCVEQYDKAFDDLKELLLDDPAYAESLGALERRLGETISQLRELDEAIWAGTAAMNMILGIESSLGSAENWGTWDLFGGGLISDLAKHSHMDDAQAGAEELQVLLSRFRTELADVRITAEMGALNIDGFLRFADYFFDGLIADWSVLNRIHESQDCVHQVKYQIEGALTKLSVFKEARAAEKTELEIQIEALVAGSSQTNTIFAN
jgi:hypothetical protein